MLIMIFNFVLETIYDFIVILDCNYFRFLRYLQGQLISSLFFLFLLSLTH